MSDSADEDAPQDVEDIEKEMRYETNRPASFVIVVLLAIRMLLWIIVTLGWILYDPLVLLLPMAGIYWALTDGTSVVGYIEQLCTGKPVVEHPNHRVFHIVMWVSVTFYLIKVMQE